MTEEKKDRREFLVKVGVGAGVVGICTQAAASLRSLLPNVSYDAPTTVKLGAPAEFPDGMKFLPEQRLFVFREGKTFHAISAVCTHLGCLYDWKPTEGLFICPCHGSTFQKNGVYVRGPAPRNLDRFQVQIKDGSGATLATTDASGGPVALPSNAETIAVDTGKLITGARHA